MNYALIMWFVLFLRGINLGKRRVKNEAMCGALVDAGFAGVSAYQASGNVLLWSTHHKAADLEKDVSRVLKESLGFTIEAFARSYSGITKVLEASPFGRTGEGKGAGKPQVVFLQKSLSPASLRAVSKLSTENERLVGKGKEIYWWPALGISKSTLDWKEVERAAGRTTVRTQGTVERILAKLDKQEPPII